jgi:ABC-type transport system involved in multi-copper enzyme maturation permease subunit
MKFLAVLKDSFREAIDTKVFYVLLGLSVLLTLLAASISFVPQPGGERVIREFAILPLNVDSARLDSAQMMAAMFQARPVRFEAVSVEPVDGVDAPGSSFKVKLRATFAGKEAAARARDNPETVVDFIRERFGMIEGVRMMEPADVGFIDWEKGDLLGGLLGGSVKGTFELTARPTPVTIRFWPHRFTLLFGALPLFNQDGAALYAQLFLIEDVIVGWVGSTIAVLIGVIITAFFIPNMLRKGTIDLLLVKPISRARLLLYKYVGGLTFILLTTLTAVGGVWLALGLRSGIWAGTFLLNVAVLTFGFAVLYSVSTLFGVLTRSPVTAILLTCATWFVLFIVGFLNTTFETFRAFDRTARAMEEKLGKEGMKSLEQMAAGQGGGGRGPRFSEIVFEETWFTKTVSVLHTVLPRTLDLYQLIEARMRHELAVGEMASPPADDKPAELPGGIPLPQVAPRPPNLVETLGVSLAFIAVMLGIGCTWFAYKDY